MNERIRQLAEQAGMNAIEPVMDFDRKETHWNGWASAMEKFAELIVQECVTLADKEAERFSNLDQEYCAMAMDNYRELVRKHFGVEE